MHFAAPVTGLIAGVIRMIWSGHALLASILPAVVWAVCFYAVAWSGTFLINYIWLTPAALHREQEVALGVAREEVRRLREPAPIAPAAMLSPTDQRLLDRARADLRSLSFEQRVLLRLVCNSPGQFSGEYIRQLHALGFPDSEAILKRLISATVLLGSSPQMRISQSPHGAIAHLVEEEMAKPDWAGI